MDVYAAFHNCRLFRNIPRPTVQSMAEVAVAAFMPFVAQADKTAELSIETDMQAMDTFSFLENRVKEQQLLSQHELVTFCKVVEEAESLISLIDQLPKEAGDQQDRVFAAFEFDRLREAIHAVEKLMRTATS